MGNTITYRIILICAVHICTKAVHNAAETLVPDYFFMPGGAERGGGCCKAELKGQKTLVVQGVTN